LVTIYNAFVFVDSNSSISVTIQNSLANDRMLTQ